MNMRTTTFNVDRFRGIYPDAGCPLNYNNAFELLIVVVLSAQTTDVSVNKISPALFEKYPTCYELSEAKVEDVEEIIKTIGLYKTKASNIIKLSARLKEVYNGEVPGNFSELLTLPGVGRKTANAVLSEWFKIPRIPVDTHVYRLARRIGLATGKTAEKVERELMENIDIGDWNFFHYAMKEHGRKVCKARNPDCDNCKISDICEKNL